MEAAFLAAAAADSAAFLASAAFALSSAFLLSSACALSLAFLLSSFSFLLLALLLSSASSFSLAFLASASSASFFRLSEASRCLALKKGTFSGVMVKERQSRHFLDSYERKMVVSV